MFPFAVATIRAIRRTRQRRSLHIDDATMTMLTDLCQAQHEQARACDVELDPDPFIFTLATDASTPMPLDVLTKHITMIGGGPLESRGRLAAVGRALDALAHDEAAWLRDYLSFVETLLGEE